jgi:type 1 fimbria pilin
VGGALPGNACLNNLVFVDGTQTIDGNPDNRLGCSIGYLLTTSSWMGRFIIQLYKTAETTGSGSLSAGDVGALILRTNGNSWASPEAKVRINTIAVNTVACTLNNATISVPMGDVNKPMFNGPGSWPEDINTRSFVIPLSCDAETRVNLQIDGDVQNAAQGILNISGGNNSASGVGIQVLYENKPLTLSTAINTGTASTNGIYNISLKARYYQTDNNITAGVANASATFTLTYQ